MPARISWVTNNWAPYRRPVWDHIGIRVPLTVHLLEATPAEMENRGQDWALAKAAPMSYAVRTPLTLRVPWPGYPLSLLVAPWRMVRSTDVVVLGGWEDLSYWQLLLLARLHRCRVVGFYESTALTNRYRRGLIALARRSYFRSLDAVVTAGTASTNALISFGVKPDRIFEGFNAVDVKGANAAASQARAEAGGREVPRGKLIYVGQLIARKNVDSLLASLALLPSEFTLTIVGTGSDEHYLRERAKTLGVAERMQFLGYQPSDTIPQLLAEHATLVLPSFEEVWGLVVNEALASGLHVVVSRVSGVSESVSHMQGVYLAGTSAEELAQQILTSATAWTGPIDEPEILAHTPEGFADTFLRAAGLSECGGDNERLPAQAEHL